MTITTRPTTQISPGALQALAARLTGELITPDHDQFDTVRKVHDITIDRKPLAIVRPASTEDVGEAVRFARAHGLELAVRSGGHGVAGHSMIDGAIVVDMSSMKGISIDPAARTARVEAGVTSGDLAGPAHAYGLALSTGDTQSVGLGGLVTGGGIGWMVRKHGLAIDNLLSVGVVTAEGDVVKASASENPDLFWAIRGGGGNFGIVAEFEFRMAQVGQVLGGVLVLPASRDVIRRLLDYVVTAPDGLTTITNLMHAPPAPFIPQERIGELVLAINICWTGTIADGERAIAPLRALATPVADVVSPIPYPVMYQFTEPASHPMGVGVRAMYSQEIGDATIDACLEAMTQATSPMTMVQFRGLGGEMARVGKDDTAFAHRDKNYLVAILALWQDPDADAAPHHAWTSSLWQQIQCDAAGAYVNFLSDEGEERIREAYPETTYTRLREVKGKYDPANFFKFNQNIKPRQ